MPPTGTQHTLPIPAVALQTTPARYLHRNDLPDTEPVLLFDPPLLKPPREHVEPHPPPGTQVTLARWIPAMCPVCYDIQPNVAEHLLVTHADVVNERLRELAESQECVVEYADSGSSVIAPVRDVEPTAYKQTESNDGPGESLSAGRDPRECDDCGMVMSKSYARIFASPSGELWCPDCRSRSERYSNEGGRTHGTDPSLFTGSGNPNAAKR